jgi:hypothetical protein
MKLKGNELSHNLKLRILEQFELYIVKSTRERKSANNAKNSVPGAEFSTRDN